MYILFLFQLTLTIMSIAIYVAPFYVFCFYVNLSDLHCKKSALSIVHMEYKACEYSESSDAILFGVHTLFKCHTSAYCNVYGF